MTYLKQNNKKSSNTKRLVILIIFILILLFGFFNVVFPEKFVQSVGYPILKARQTALIPFSGIINYFSSKKTLIEAVEDLEKKLLDTKLQYLEMQLLESEIRELRAILGRGEEGIESVVGNILVKPPQSIYDTFVIDLGKDDVDVGNHVFAEGIRIGEILERSGNTSIARLNSSPGIKTQIVISGEFSAEAEGKGGGRFVAILPRDIQINKGDSVSILGANSILGVVESIDSEDGDSFQNIYFNLPISLSKITLVEVRK